MTNGCDYSFWRPSSESDLDGYDFVCRYLSNTTSKNLTLAEAQQLTSWGKMIVANWESTGTGGSYQQGVADAQTARQQALACSMPAGRPIYFSIDEDVEPSTQQDYFEGIASVIPLAEIGVYGSAEMVQFMVGAGLAKWGWRTMSTGWSGGASTQDCQIEQTGGNDSMDFDTALAEDYGQWNLNVVAAASNNTTTVAVEPSTSEEDDDMSQQSENGLAELAWAAGAKHNLEVGYDGEAPTLRIVLQLTTGPLVLENAWTPSGGTGVVEIPAQYIQTCRGAIFEATNKSVVYVVYAG